MQSLPNSNIRVFGPPRDTHYGFQLRFDNGYTVSVVYGSMMYCSMRNKKPNEIIDSTSSPDAEVAIFDNNGDMVKFDSTEDFVKGWVTPNNLADIITWTASRKDNNG